MTDTQLALLGDHAAAKRLTEQGVLLPCPFCGGDAILRRVGNLYSTYPNEIRDKWTVECKKCCFKNNVYESKIFQDDKGTVIIKNNGAEQASLAWNTRAAVLSFEEMEMLNERSL